MVEKEVVTGKRPLAVSVPGAGRKPMPLKDVSTTAEDRVSLGSAEVDRLLGGGIVKGSLVLMGGEPGIGKSTLSLQIPLSCPSLKVLYVTGEESVKQVKMRADRLGGDASNCLIYSETLMDNIIAEAEETAPDLVIVDSVQTMYCGIHRRLRDAGQGGRRRAAPLREGQRHPGHPHRPHHQGRRHRGPEGAGAHRRCGPAVRGREPRSLPCPEEHQEPFRLHGGARRVRDDRRRPPPGGESFRAPDSPARGRAQRHGRERHAGRQPSLHVRGAGAGLVGRVRHGAAQRDGLRRPPPEHAPRRAGATCS